MLAICPSCQTKFAIPKDAVAVGDMVQCSVCDEEWAYTPNVTATPVAAATNVSDDTGVEKLQTIATKRPSNKQSPAKSVVQVQSRTSALAGEVEDMPSARGQGGTLLTLVMFVGLLAVTLVLFRPQIVERFPLSTVVYSKIDMATKQITTRAKTYIDTVFGEKDMDSLVRASVVRAVISNVNGKRMLIIHGVVRNVSTQGVKGVLLNTDLRDNSGVVIKTISFTLNTQLKSGQVETFKITVPEPPIGANDIQIRVSK